MKKLLFACLVATAFAAQAETKWDLPSVCGEILSIRRIWSNSLKT